jgi:hypothetical protein
MSLFQQKLCTESKKVFCCLSWERLATTLYRGRLTDWQILFKGDVSTLKQQQVVTTQRVTNLVCYYFWPECEAGRMKKILNHNWSLLCRAYSEVSLICHGLIGLYIPSVVVVSHTSGGRKYLWWRQCGPVMSSWSNGLLAGLLQWRHDGPEVS